MGSIIKNETERKMEKLSESYRENIARVASRLRVTESFDIIRRDLSVSGLGVTFFYVDGFIKDAEMQRVMQFMLSRTAPISADEALSSLPYVEVDKTEDADALCRAVLSGQAAIIAESFGGEAILVDARTYPARQTEEPDSDRVMQGSHDGFVETLVINTALIRRRIRDSRLTMSHVNMGGSSSTDVVVAYMNGVADGALVKSIKKKLREAKPRSLTLGFQSLSESLIKRGWWNPFPKIRTTERPDTAAAQLLEGSVLIICDTSPQVMILPTSIFHYLEQTDDYYFPPLTGSYLRIVRTLILLASVVVTPLWYLAVQNAAVLPDALAFLIPDEPGALPIIFQLLLVELAIDGLKIASMNTPDMLSNSLSIVGALILGDFAVEVGWLCADVILYMAFVAIANFAQQNHELGYAFKFMRVLTLILVYFLGAWGFALGMLVFAVTAATNRTVTDTHYLYPLVPFSWRDMKRLLFRHRKGDFDTDGEKTVDKSRKNAR